MVSSRAARVLPEPLGGIELRRVRRQLVDFQPVTVGPEPGPDLGILVVGSVVLDQDRPLPAIAARQLFPKGQVAPRVEDRVLAVRETRAPQFDGAQDLDAVALSRDSDFGRLADAAPGGLPSRVLSEAGFVGKNQRPVFRAGFFLRLG